MARAEGETSAVPAPRKRRTRPRDMMRGHMEALHAAKGGDFAPFMALVQTPGPSSEGLLDGDLMPVFCKDAIEKARIDNAGKLDARVAAALVSTPEIRASIVRAVSHQAEHDLCFALYALVIKQEALSRLVASAGHLADHAYRLLDNRLSEALGQPVDYDIILGAWPLLLGSRQR